MKPFSCLDIVMLPLDLSYKEWSGGWMPTPLDMDFMPETGMPTYIILRENAPPIRFSGEHKVSRKIDHSAHPIVGPWSAVDIFKTPGGKFVCQENFKEAQPHETTEHFVEIFDDEQSAADFLARSSLTFEGLLDRLSDCLAKRLSQTG